jgi:hypothetical protein
VQIGYYSLFTFILVYLYKLTSKQANGSFADVSEMLDAWPVLPVSLISSIDQSDQRWDNMVATLEWEHYNRICYINTRMTNSWERVAAVMQKPFPEADTSASLAESFLGGSAPRLRTLSLERIPFPSMPKLLLSADGLVTLHLWNIPNSGYFSPDAMATALTAMTRLEILRLQFPSPLFRLDTESRSLPPPTRLVVPALRDLSFWGVYEDLLARVPLFNDLYIEFFMDLDFDVPQLHRLIGHAEELKRFDRAYVSIYDHSFR